MGLPLPAQAAYDAAFMAAQNIPAPVKLREKAQLMTASEMEAALARIAAEIVSRNDGVNGLGFMGIRRRGVPMAERLSKLIERADGATMNEVIEVKFMETDGIEKVLLMEKT